MPRPLACGVFGAATAALLAVLLGLERRMRRAGGPGIVAFELAGTPERSRRIADRWGREGRAAARRSLQLDYPFLVSYTGLGVTLCGAAGDALRAAGAPPLAYAAPGVRAALVAAGACDAAENTALLGILRGRYGRLPALARAFARAKFALLALGSLYGVLGAAAQLTRWWRSGRS
jgi:hypothetical protein